ncbi:MAG: hypothetical protein ACRDX9_00975 [Acidimicrobiia bacterium]
MTSEPPATPESTPPTPAPAASPLTGMSGEMMVMISGAVVLGVFVIFGLILDEWYPPYESIIPASFAVLLPRLTGTPVGSGISTATLLKISGYVIAVAGLWDFVDTIRFGWGDAVDVIAWLLLAAAAVFAFLGARAIEA